MIQKVNQRVLAIGLLIVLGAATLFAYRNATRGPILSGTCRELPTAAGVADISVDAKRGVAYLAYIDRTPDAAGKMPTGTIMLVDLTAKEPRVRAALNSDPADFRPMAVSVYAPVEGPRRLFVVDANDAIHIFEESPGGAFVLAKLVRDSRLSGPARILAAGVDQFYVVDKQAWWNFGAPSVAFYDGQWMTSVTADKAKEVVTATALASQLHADAAGRYEKSTLIGTVTPHKLMLCTSAT